jgi:hypothetical protein
MVIHDIGYRIKEFSDKEMDGRLDCIMRGDGFYPLTFCFRYRKDDGSYKYVNVVEGFVLNNLEEVLKYLKDGFEYDVLGVSYDDQDEPETNWSSISINQELFDAAIKETQEYYISKGLDVDNVGFKEIAEYVNSKPFPYKPKGE